MATSYTSYYVRGSTLPRDEDQRTEFKGHRAFAQEEINPNNFIRRENNVQKTRQAISKYFCGMLNEGRGGKLFLGVLDSGRIEGFMMNEYQKDHVRLSVRDTLRRYRPPVPPHMYTLAFVPVIDDFEAVDQETVSKTLDNLARHERLMARIKPETREIPHTIRTWRFCWCDAEASGNFNMGLMNPFFVVEIIVHPWDPEDPRNAVFKMVDFVTLELSSFDIVLHEGLKLRT